MATQSCRYIANHQFFRSLFNPHAIAFRTRDADRKIGDPRLPAVTYLLDII